MKKTLAFILITAMLFSYGALFGLTASAEDDICSDLYEAMIGFDEYVNISKYNLSFDEAFSFYSSTVFNNPELFYVNGKSLSYSLSGNYISRIYIRYLYTGEEYTEMKSFIDSEMGLVISRMPSGLDDYEKALFLHDVICLEYEYDTSYSIYDYPTMLKEKKGVCQAYTTLYAAMLARVGIPSCYISSDEINHAWNEICVGGSWYYVDVTWDDPIPDKKGRAVHTYFLLSESAFNNHGSDYVPEHPCTDTRFDNAYWHRINNAFAFSDKAYFVDDSVAGTVRVFGLDLASEEYTEFVSLPTVWYANSEHTSYYTSGFSSTVIYNNVMLFNTYSDIMAFYPESGIIEKLLTPNDVNGGIFGMYQDNGMLYYGYNQNYSSLTYGSVSLSSLIKSVIGDFNNNGYFDSADLILACQSDAGIITVDEATLSRIDVNGDGVFDPADLICMCQYDAGIISAWPCENK